jgi:hypothetical protein
LRVGWLDNFPPALNWDEASHGYNAYSILKTGQDEWGERFPSIFLAYGDYKLPVYIYLTTVSVFIFGLNTFAVRLPSVLAGIGIVIFTYLLTKELFKKSKANTELLALIASSLVAIEPWTLFLSRGAFEANVALFLFVAGVYFFLKSYQSPHYVLLSTTFFGLTVWTYNSYRIFTPLIMFVLIMLYKKDVLSVFKKNKNLIAYCLLPIAFFFIPMIKQLAADVGQARYAKVAIIDEGAINKINEQRNIHDYHPVVERVLYNKPIFFVKTAVNNWVKYFTGNFIFISGGDQYQYNVQNHGLVYLTNLPFVILGSNISFIMADICTNSCKHNS